ncbi:uncharacterized protein LTR77_008567 [Saxophila tyrrhenica]|uniref:7-dehydrocholesterol reductase n=1 Tax=Saxophila tyrrhenica TaxID=1690608 RepID=A0AAV9P1C4_9PEZI|nr:hypothetical protein LTR77_008567 [Saxophila tyrrhenica]
MKAVIPAAQDAVQAITSAVSIDGASWGRADKAKWPHNVTALLVFVAPTWMYINWLALEHYDASLLEAGRALFLQGPVQLMKHHFPQPTFAAFVGYAAWLGLQTALYGLLPGKHCFGQRTPGGHLLEYTANGLLAWAVTHGLYLAAAVTGMLDPAIMAKHWQGLFVAANLYGVVLAVLAQVKGYWCPSYPADRKMSGSWIFDFWAGVELNPRLGDYWDFKFFHNGRPGIVAWTLIDLSWTAYQYQNLGHIATSMCIVLLFHTIYVVDFFLNEDWYTRTIDITHDHFGFMLAWGDTTFLPAFYTLQAQYLARYPAYLSTAQSATVLVLGIGGYAIFRIANHQKDYVRSRNGNAILWDRPATFIRCNYRTSDGKEHSSILLTSGWWAVSRHSNYLGDLILAFAMCAACGVNHVLPWSYFFYMTVLLCHRVWRDEHRCHIKYGKKWEEYCAKVPYRIMPGVW